MVKRKVIKEPLPSSINEIEFNLVDLNYRLRNKKKIKRWIQYAIRDEGLDMGYLSFNFCSDDYLLAINKKHLHHDYFTDIITFDFCEGTFVSGDIYISLDRVKENAKKENKTTINELNRVIIHGTLHLCGYKDKKASDTILMRQKEDYYLSLWP